MTHSRWRASGWLVLLAVVLGGCGGPPASSAPTGTPTPAAASTPASPTSDSATPAVSGPARIVATTKQGRSTDITIASPAVGGPVRVRLLLPAHFLTQPKRRWPVLYLLHGCCDTYVSWTRSTDIEQLSADEDLLVVMPDGGKVGFYTDWRTGPGWETFHTQELPRLLSAQFRANDRAAIAGASMGGLGALGYAARHPGRYTAAASFSGIVHTRLSRNVSQGYLSLVSAEGAVDPLALWGDPDTDAAVWKAHNPYDLAPRLTDIPLFVSAGDGQPGPLDDDDTPPDSIEPLLHIENRQLVRRLRQVDAAVTVDLYGSGTHNWVYWQRELHRAWPLLTDHLISN